jgi:hypothetical protein
MAFLAESSLMKRVSLFGLLVVAMAFSIAAIAPAAEDVDAKKQAELEAKFAALLSNSVMKGGFTLGELKPGEPLKEDKYTLGDVKKLENGKWLFSTRIQYGENDVTVPLALDVLWAGDTPVITVQEMPVPGLGTFSARVVVDVPGKKYAGTWDGGDHGGHLFGVVEHPAKAGAN